MKIGEMVATDRPAVLKTALDSCVGIVHHDYTNHIAEIVHIMLPKMPEKVELIKQEI